MPQRALDRRSILLATQCIGMLTDFPSELHPSITWLTNVDVAQPTAGRNLTAGLPPNTPLDITIVTAGYFAKETFESPDFDAQVDMYKISAVGPVLLAQALVHAGHLDRGSKLILVSSEAGSLALRHESEGGGMYGHHGSKAALNMAGRLLSFDLKEKGIAVGLVHPGFMKTEMTRSVGFDKYWDSGGAVTPDVAAESLRGWVVQNFTMERTGELWAPRGTADIGTWEKAVGKGHEDEARLPW